MRPTTSWRGAGRITGISTGGSTGRGDAGRCCAVRAIIAAKTSATVACSSGVAAGAGRAADAPAEASPSTPIASSFVCACSRAASIAAIMRRTFAAVALRNWLVTTRVLIAEVVKAVKRMPAVTVGRRVTDTVKRVEKGTTVAETIAREKLWAVQTPQAFQLRALRDAYKALPKREVTDDCQAIELAGGEVKIIENRKPNFKITTVEDLQIAGALLK